MKNIEHELRPFCKIIYLHASVDDDIISTYHKYENKVDGFIFSGRLIYYLLLESIPLPNKPCFYLDNSMTDIKDIFLNLIMNDRNFDFSRLCIDMATDLNDFLGIKDILSEDQLPYFNDIDYEGVTACEQLVLDRHIDLHKAGLIDISITRMGNYLDVLETHNIPYIYACPSISYTTSFFMKAIYQINLSKTQNQIMGAIYITLDDTDTCTGHSNTIHLSKLCILITTYSQIHGYDFTLQEYDSHIEVLTHYRDIAKITEEFTTCTIQTYLEEHSDKHIVLGLGTGHNIYKAKLHAQEATKISKQTNEGPFYISNDDDVIGPLMGLTKIYNSSPSQQLLAKSKELHVDPINLQKIVAFTEMIESTTVTSDILAEYLNISLRSANRLLTKISENKGASTYYQNIDGKPGRPKKYFDLKFTNEIY